jgi:hypothetical protein
MAGELSEYAYGKIKIRVMKVNKERSFPTHRRMRAEARAQCTAAP